MRTIFLWANTILKALAWLIVAILILLGAIGYMAVVSVVWAINPIAGMGLLIFGLAVVAMVAYS